MKKHVHDPRQLTLDDLFEIPRPVHPAPASMDYDKEIRHLLSAALKQTKKTRYEICARMSELIGHEITISMLNAWTAESREGWRFPLAYATPFEIACDTFVLTEHQARNRGCKVYAGDEVRQAEIGRLESQMDELSAKLKALKKARITD
jgi:hypothetical protein